MLRHMSALDQQAWERRFRIHRRDQPIEAEHLSLSLKETCIKDPIKRAVPPQQLRGAFCPDPGSAMQFVRRITAKRNKVRNLGWIDGISWPDLFGAEGREFAVLDGRGLSRLARRAERISIAADDRRGIAYALLSGDCVVRPDL